MCLNDDARATEDAVANTLHYQPEEVLFRKIEWAWQHASVFPPRQTNLFLTRRFDQETFDACLVSARKNQNRRLDFLCIVRVSHGSPVLAAWPESPRARSKHCASSGIGGEHRNWRPPAIDSWQDPRAFLFEIASTSFSGSPHLSNRGVSDPQRAENEFARGRRGRSRPD